MIRLARIVVLAVAAVALGAFAQPAPTSTMSVKMTFVQGGALEMPGCEEYGRGAAGAAAASCDIACATPFVATLAKAQAADVPPAGPPAAVEPPRAVGRTGPPDPRPPRRLT